MNQKSLKYGNKHTNVSSDFTATDRVTPLKKEGRESLQPRSKGFSKQQINTSNSSMMQPRILSKTSKNSLGASKEHLVRAPNAASGQAGQVLINQYVSTKKRGLRRNISGERISSIERTSQVAEQIFLNQPSKH